MSEMLFIQIFSKTVSACLLIIWQHLLLIIIANDNNIDFKDFNIFDKESTILQIINYMKKDNVCLDEVT